MKYRLSTSSAEQTSASSVVVVSTLKEQLRLSPNDASLWRQLGKLQLDAGEYAEAYRIFRRGASLCPEDDSLRHYQQVWEAFHGEQQQQQQQEAEQAEESSSPPSISTDSIGRTREVYLSLDVPDVPLPIQRWEGKVPPTKRQLLLHASKEPILTREACRYLINAATKVATTRGWTKDRHLQAPTCDIPVHDLPLSVQRWVRNTMFGQVICPTIRELFGDQLDHLDSLRVQDCFIVRYDDNANAGPGFAHLKPHEDESLISLTIALNDMDVDYEGGGLYVASTQDLLNGPAGTVLCFAGSVVHGGYPVTKGTRWILTAFLYCDANASGKEPGYTMKDVEIVHRRT